MTCGHLDYHRISAPFECDPVGAAVVVSLDWSLVRAVASTVWLFAAARIIDCVSSRRMDINCPGRRHGDWISTNRGSSPRVAEGRTTLYCATLSIPIERNRWCLIRKMLVGPIRPLEKLPTITVRVVVCL